jgi:hypothetical protein
MTGRTGPSDPGPVVIVHHIQHVRRAVAAAVAAERPVTLLSAPDAAAAIGPAVFQSMIEAVLAENPPMSTGIATGINAVIDCGSDPGHALKALREGCTRLRIDADDTVLAKLRDMAGADGLVLAGDPLSALDLSDPLNTDAVLLDWLEEPAARH